MYQHVLLMNIIVLENYSAGEYLRLQNKVPKGMISLFNQNNIEDHYLQSNLICSQAFLQKWK